MNTNHKTIQLRHGSSKLQAAEWVRSSIEAGVLPRINEMLQMDNDKPKFGLEKKVIKSKEVVDTDPTDNGKQMEFDYPSEVEKEISIKVEMIRVKKMKKELETDQKVEVAMFKEQQKADECHSKSLKSLLAAQFKNI
ncbi:hypothetical protein BDR26DRAFT_929459 [Obelidium mucronatum]|nr:hypothetical protein BDR26DRAFT_929459 [Obelidium mucronatum]